MQFRSPSTEESQAELISELEKRVERLESEISFLKERGLSSEEQDIVLDRRQKIRKPRKNLLPLFLIFFLLMFLWCSFLTYQVYFSSPDKNRTVSDGDNGKADNKTGKSSTFSLPPRIKKSK